MNYYFNRKYHFSDYYLEALFTIVKNRHDNCDMKEFDEKILKNLINKKKYPEDYKLLKRRMLEYFTIRLPGI